MSKAFLIGLCLFFSDLVWADNLTDSFVLGYPGEQVIKLKLREYYKGPDFFKPSINLYVNEGYFRAIQTYFKFAVKEKKKKKHFVLEIENFESVYYIFYYICHKAVLLNKDIDLVRLLKIQSKYNIPGFLKDISEQIYFSAFILELCPKKLGKYIQFSHSLPDKALFNAFFNYWKVNNSKTVLNQYREASSFIKDKNLSSQLLKEMDSISWNKELIEEYRSKKIEREEICSIHDQLTRIQIKSEGFTIKIKHRNAALVALNYLSGELPDHQFIPTGNYIIVLPKKLSPEMQRRFQDLLTEEDKSDLNIKQVM